MRHADVENNQHVDDLYIYTSSNIYQTVPIHFLSCEFQEASVVGLARLQFLKFFADE